MAETKSQQSRLLVTLTALFAAFCGLYLLIGGVWLVALGGSWYYPIAGLVMLGVTVLLCVENNLRCGCMPRCFLPP
jgi:quinoprotein glucose dehydrogenase